MDYASNSNKNKEKQKQKEEKKVEKVISGEVVQKKKSLGRRFKDLFFGGDFKAAARYVTGEVLLPSMRNMMADASKGAIDRVIYGESAYGRRRTIDGRSMVQYNNPINRVRDPRDPRTRVYLPDQPPFPYRQNRREANDIILQSREEAELVLERLGDIVDQYEIASLADLYDLVGLPSSHVDQKWGWTDVIGSRVTQIRDGFVLELPPLEAI